MGGGEKKGKWWCSRFDLFRSSENYLALRLKTGELPSAADPFQKASGRRKKLYVEADRLAARSESLDDGLGSFVLSFLLPLAVALSHAGLKRGEIYQKGVESAQFKPLKHQDPGPRSKRGEAKHRLTTRPFFLDHPSRTVKE